MKIPTGLVLLLIVPLSGCLVTAEDTDDLSKADKCEFALTAIYIEGSEQVDANGTLRYLDIEGGFWGIIADDGRKFQLGSDDFCKDLQKDGQRVHFMGRTRPDMAGIHMWGTHLELTLIERA